MSNKYLDKIAALDDRLDDILERHSMEEWNMGESARDKAMLAGMVPVVGGALHTAILSHELGKLGNQFSQNDIEHAKELLRLAGSNTSDISKTKAKQLLEHGRDASSPEFNGRAFSRGLGSGLAGIGAGIGAGALAARNGLGPVGSIGIGALTGLATLKGGLSLGQNWVDERNVEVEERQRAAVQKYLDKLKTI